MNQYGNRVGRSAYTGRFPRSLDEIGWSCDRLLPMPSPPGRIARLIEQLARLIAGF